METQELSKKQAQENFLPGPKMYKPKERKLKKAVKNIIERTDNCISMKN